MDCLWVLVEFFNGATLPYLPSRFYFQTMVEVVPFFCLSFLLLFCFFLFFLSFFS